MTTTDIVNLRLHNQYISDSPYKEPDEIVSWLGAIQSQDYASAKWAIGLRLPNSHEEDIEQAFAKGTILRTHILRPTWHFVAPEDIRWMLALTAPRVHAINAYYCRKLGLDNSLLQKCTQIVSKALQGGKELTREELKGILEKKGIAIRTTDTTVWLSCIMMNAELQGIICSGPRKGKQFTYTLLEERAPHVASITREEGLVKLTLCYFRSHGPATLKDYMKWSGLTATEVKTGIEMVKSNFINKTIDGQTYWFSPSQENIKEKVTTAYLLPNYDEYFSGYKDYTPIFNPSFTKQLNPLFSHSIVINGRVLGAWKRVLKKDTVIITPLLFIPFTKEQRQALIAAVDNYGKFLNKKITLENAHD